MSGTMALVMLVAVVAWLPMAEAHDCNGRGCGPCVKGEYHNHNDWERGQCASGPGYVGENGYGGGQRFEAPGGAVVGSVLGMAGAALLVARRAPPGA